MTLVNVEMYTPRQSCIHEILGQHSTEDAFTAEAKCYLAPVGTVYFQHSDHRGAGITTLLCHTKG